MPPSSKVVARIGWCMISVSCAQLMECGFQMLVASGYTTTASSTIWVYITGFLRGLLHFSIIPHITKKGLPHILEDEHRGDYSVYKWFYILLTISNFAAIISGVLLVPDGTFFPYYLTCVVFCALDTVCSFICWLIGLAWCENRPPPSANTPIDEIQALPYQSPQRHQGDIEIIPHISPTVETPVRTTPRKECTICLDAGKDTMVLPCKHYAFCERCARASTLCPICRTPITGVSRVFEG